MRLVSHRTSLGGTDEYRGQTGPLRRRARRRAGARNSRCSSTGQAARERSRPTPHETLTIDPTALLKPWIGDLDGMIERRLIRVLRVDSKTFYFVDKGTQRGIVVDVLKVFEERAQQETRRGKQPQQQKPEGPGGLYPGTARPTAAGLAAAGRHRRRQPHHHAQRQQMVDFSTAAMGNVSEIVVPGPARRGSPAWTISPARRSSSASRRATTRAWSRSTRIAPRGKPE